MFPCNCPEETCQSPFRAAGTSTWAEELPAMPKFEAMRPAKFSPMAAAIFHAECGMECHWVRRQRPDPEWKISQRQARERVDFRRNPR